MRPAVGLGDLLRAWAAVGYAPEQLRPLAALLDLEPAVVAAAVARVEAAPSQLGSVTVGASAVIVPSDTSRLDAPTTDVLATRLEILPPVPPPRPAWTSAGARIGAGHRFEPRTPRSLFRPERERALLAAAAGRARAEGEIDVPKLVEARARGRHLRVVPRRVLVSPRGGVQLVLDRSTWMAPFAADVDWLEARMRTVSGAALEVATVDDAPPLVRLGDADDALAWRPPPPGATLVVVSDLGRAARRAGRRAPEAAWRDLLERAQALQLDPVVIVPGRVSNYATLDAALRRSLFLGWDDRARVAGIMHFRRTRRR
ncbi:MAG TPA: hypothetical protein VGM88_07790 [Kofleriaceae bacterium]|jgi:hypothetical protein